MPLNYFNNNCIISKIIELTRTFWCATTRLVYLRREF